MWQELSIFEEEAFRTKMIVQLQSLCDTSRGLRRLTREIATLSDCKESASSRILEKMEWSRVLTRNNNFKHVLAFWKVVN